MNKFLRSAQSDQKIYTLAGKWVLVLGALYLTSLYSYLLFHTFAEIFSAAVALAIFMLVWNVRRSMDNNYLLFVGVAFLFVGALDLLHTLAYKGMGVFGAYEEDLPTQLWIGVRYMQSISLLIAPFFLGKRLNLKFLVASYVLASLLLLGAVFYWEVFPVCFVPGKGLTPFKVLSEYVISVILLAAIALLAKKRDRFDPPVFRFLVLSIVFTIVSELSFTLYMDVYGFFSLIGHFLKIIAFYCIYKAIVEQGVAKPLEVLFRNLKLSEEALRGAHDHLEAQVQLRTAELAKTCEQLSRQIGERKRAEECLELERNKLGSILDNMADGVYIADAQYRIEYANPALEKEFGPVNGRKCHEYLEGNKEPCAGCKHDEVFAGKSLQWEWRSEITGKTYEVFDTLIRNADGTVARLEILHDVSSRKAAEKAMRDSEEKYRIVADNTYDWEWWIGPDGKFVYISPSCKEITHYAGEEFTADPELLSRIVHPEDFPAFKLHLAEVEDKRLNGEVEFRIIRSDGSVRWLAHVCRAIFDEKGGFLGRRGNNRDITERKKAEDALKESEKRYRTLVETMNEGLAIADEQGVWTYVNENFCKMVGYSREEMIGRPVHEWLDEDNRKVLAEQWNKRIRGEQGAYEIAGIRKDGFKIHALIAPRPIMDEAGQFRGSFAVITDISDRKKAEETILNALAEIKILKDRIEAENIYLRLEMKMESRSSNIIGESNAIKYVLYRVEQVAPTNTTVLVLGETGTGKDLIATAIHQMSLRKDRPLITLNCAALPANLIESELFGREKGAFTGADTRQIGRFEIADGSTLCLDEIGELPLELQAKLLRVIQHGEFERLGSSRAVKVDVRIVATTNRNLEEETRNGRFRQDLYYRLNVFPITVPPLRQRREDIPLLVHAFTERYARAHGKEFTSIQNEAMSAMQDYDWPGNVRELENVIERAVIMCPGPVLQLVDRLESDCSSPSSLRTLEEIEREQILKTLSETGWRINGKKGAAAILGLHPSTLRARMHKLGINRPELKT